MPQEEVDLNDQEVDEELDPGRQWIEERVSSLRPWREVFDKESFERPTSPSQAGDRVWANLKHYSTNYVVVFACVSLVLAVTNPPFFAVLLVCGLVAAANIKYGQDFKVATYRIRQRERLIAVGVVLFIIIFITSVASDLLYLIGVTFFICFTHALFRKSEAEERHGLAGTALSALGV